MRLVTRTTENYILSRFDRNLSLLVAEATTKANIKMRRATAGWVPGGQSRQAQGIHFRQDWIAGLVMLLAPLGLRLLSVDQDGEKASIHSEPLAADLFQLGELYLWPTRLRSDGRFMHRPSQTISQVASIAQSGRPLFQDEDRPHFAALFYVYDDATQVVERTGIGTPSSTLSKIATAIIPNFRVHAASLRSASRVATQQTRGARVSLRQDDHAGTSEPAEHQADDIDGKN